MPILMNTLTWNGILPVPIDERRVMAAVDVEEPTLKGADPTLHTVLGYFVHFLPVEYLKTVVIPQTNAAIKEPVTWEEFLRFFGIIFIMATTQGNARKDFWASDTPEIFSGAPFRLNPYISRRRLERILQNLKLTHDKPPPFKHPFHPVSDLLTAFNSHTRMLCSGVDQLLGRINVCVDQSMDMSGVDVCPPKTTSNG